MQQNTRGGAENGHLQGEHGEGEVVDPEALLGEALLQAEVLVHLAQQLHAALRQDALAPIQQLPYLYACGACICESNKQVEAAWDEQTAIERWSVV
jgi:hypothetical protein